MGVLPWRVVGPLVATFGLHQALQRLGLAPPWAVAWLDDLLCLPLVLALALALHRRLRLGDDAFVLPVAQVAVAWVFITLVFEVALPVLDAAYVADPRDGLAYAAGAVLFQVGINRPAGGRST